MTDRVYLPSAYVDEICPTLRPSPSDWIICGEAGWHLVGNSAYDKVESDRLGDALVDGQIVSFNWREDHPSRTVTVAILDCGTPEYSPVGFVPASLNMFWIDGDFDTMADTFDSCLEYFHDFEPFTDGQTVEIDMAEWGDAQFLFTVEGDTARFVPVDEAPRRAAVQADLPGLPS